MCEGYLSLMLRKVVAGLFAISVFTLGLEPTAYAADGDGTCDLPGSGTSVAPWQIDSQADLSEIGVGDCTANYDQNHYYILTGNITLTGTWTPIPGLYSNPGFTASFDGDGYTISGLQVTGNANAVGLFGDVRSAVIKDLTLKGSSISGNDRVGSLVGFSNESTIQNVRVEMSGDVTGSTNVGGVVGEASNSNISEVFFFSLGKVQGGQYVGGAIGAITEGLVSAIHVESEVIGTVNVTGGVIGMVATTGPRTLEQLFYKGHLYGYAEVGGLLGYAWFTSWPGETLTIKYSAVLGIIETRYNIEPYAFLGLAGQLFSNGAYEANYINAQFNKCVNANNCTQQIATDVTGQQTDKPATYTSNLYAQVGASSVAATTATAADLGNPTSFSAQWRLVTQAGGAAVNAANYSWVLDTSGSRNSGMPFPAKLHNAGFFGSCDPGRYSVSGFQPCAAAPAGKYVATRAATTAVDCAAGTFQPNAGASYCLPATAGHYVANAAATAETPCPAGTYQSSTGQMVCLHSPAGSYVANPGAINHTLCAAGSYQPSTNETSCVLAGVGFYVPAPGAVAEIACAAGTQSLAAGASACVAISSSPNAYQGPIVLGASGVAEIGGEATLRGSGLGEVTSAAIDSIDCPIVTQSANSLTISLPEELTPGRKDLTLESASGKVVIQGAFRVSSPTGGSISKAKVSITRKGDSVRYFVQNPVGLGKVQFLLNGKELAWIRALDGSDPKVMRVGYFVRTRALASGLNRTEIRVANKPVKSQTFTK
jgi:hypothetical protein